MRRSRWFAHAGYLSVLAWIQLYIAREFFVCEYTGYMNSMHGFWIALARLGGDAIL